MSKKKPSSKIVETLCFINDSVTLINTWYAYPLFMPIGTRRRELHYREAMRRRKEKREHLLALRQRRLIRIKRIGEQYYVSLTKNGGIAARWERVRQNDRSLPDDHYCYVIFDIPEHARDVRNHFRLQLKRAGFEQVQLSVWRTRSDVILDLREQIADLGIAKWVSIFVAHVL